MIYKNKELEDKFFEKLEVFTKNPFEGSLRTHKLTGKLKGWWSFSLDYEKRIIFKFLEGNRVLLIDIGSHNEVY